MTDPKPFASLSSGLLARKGHAKPAMRPQGYGISGGYEDLGWNDMGHPHAVVRAAPIAEADANHLQPEPPAVVRQQAGIAEELGAQREGAPVEQVAPEQQVKLLVKPARAPKPVPAAVPAEVLPVAQSAKAKSAFTLRLDPDRHLRLRLACAVRHRSAQTIVTEALDAFLAATPEIETLARQSASVSKL